EQELIQPRLQNNDWLGAVDAADPRGLDVALAQLAGGLAGPLFQLRDALLDLLAHLEAGFDFADEDIAFIAPDEVRQQLAAAAETVQRLAGQMASRAESAERVRVALVGWPNVGKSSLFNALAGRFQAIVSEHPGTTRDYLTAELDLEGVRCVLVDLAGIEPAPPCAGSSDAEIAAAAQRAARSQIAQAAVQVFCVDGSRGLNPWEEAQLACAARNRLVVVTKSDAPRQVVLSVPAIETSSRTGQGLDVLRSRLRAAVLEAQGAESPGEVVASTAARCRQSLEMAAECLARARDVARAGTGEELVATEIRVALDELGKVVGAVYTDDLLDRIFSRFCVGK
ncbi:MAG: 50S ribosome-binding GTPase, partial [Thermoguttaceae bacterium]|nr:50S ribosome-binding GTPase [Thermoguttaceae bacterium]